MEPFSITRQSIVFLVVIAAFELAVVLMFPLIAVLFGAVAVLLLFIIWVKAGRRTRKWLWWNPAAVPLTQFEGAIYLSAALLLTTGVLVAGYEAIRFASGDRNMLAGYAFRHMLREEPASRPVSTRAVSYSDPAMQKRLKDELDKAGIRYALEITDGKEFIKWSAEHNAVVEDIQRRRVDVMFSGKENAAFPDPALQQEFTDWLTKRGIPYEMVTSSGREFVVWEKSEHDLVRQFMEERPAGDCPSGAAASASGKGARTRC